MAGKFSIKQARKKNKLFLAGIVILLVAVNILAYHFHFQADLTQDRRFSVTPQTKHMLRNLDGKVTVTVFLTGKNLPDAFKHLKASTSELLNHFSELSNHKINYQFVDPTGEDEGVLEVLKKYQMTGIPVNSSDGSGDQTQRMVFPWALVQLRPEHPVAPGDTLRSFPVFLLQANTLVVSRTLLNKSEMLLEYAFASVIHNLDMPRRDFVAYVTGNGEPFGTKIAAMFRSIGSQYNLDTVNLSTVAGLAPKYKVAIVNAPLQSFSEIEKFKLDQYLMQGGNIIWAVNAATGSIEDFGSKGAFTSLRVDLNLNDFFFNNGFRINNDLVLDAANNAGIPLSRGADDPNPQMVSWPYYPVLKPAGDHPVVKNMEGVITRLMSSIDTVPGNGADIHKTVLLTTSKYSRTAGVPDAVIYATASVEPNPAEFKKQNIIGALLLEGTFSSLYAGRMSDDVLNYTGQHKIPVLRQSVKPGKMLVVSDGDIFTNEVSAGGEPKEMGSYLYSGYHFENRELLMNTLNYMTDTDNLLGARNKDFQVRILDPRVVQDERSKWQFINIAVPIAAVLLLGGVYLFWRKRKYTGK